MPATQTEIESLADRIERAYRLRKPRWNPGCSAPGVWTAAAALLWRAHRDDPTVPLDPELYVAAQRNEAGFVDPWAELTQAAALERYRRHLRRIVSALSRELRGEVRRAERRIRRGTDLSTVLDDERPSLSALGRYIVAARGGHDTLARRWRARAASQHRSCPLYRQASLSLLAPQAYPVPAPSPALPPAPSPAPVAGFPLRLN